MGVVKICEGADLEKVAEECADKIIKEMSGAGEGADAENASGSGEENAGKENASGSGRKERDKPTEQGNCAADRQAAAGEKHKNSFSSVEKTGAFRISIEHIAGAPAASISIVGKGGDVFGGIAGLLEKTALALACGEAVSAAMIAGGIGEMVKKKILSGKAARKEEL